MFTNVVCFIKVILKSFQPKLLLHSGNGPLGRDVIQFAQLLQLSCWNTSSIEQLTFVTTTSAPTFERGTLVELLLQQQLCTPLDKRGRTHLRTVTFDIRRSPHQLRQGNCSAGVFCLQRRRRNRRRRMVPRRHRCHRRYTAFPDTCCIAGSNRRRCRSAGFNCKRIFHCSPLSRTSSQRHPLQITVRAFSRSSGKAKMATG